MDEKVGEQDVRDIFRGWVFDLHRSGRQLSAQTQHEVEQIAVLVVGSGGTLRDAFAAARSILSHPARLELASS